MNFFNQERWAQQKKQSIQRSMKRQKATGQQAENCIQKNKPKHPKEPAKENTFTKAPSVGRFVIKFFKEVMFSNVACAGTTT
jgi:ATP-dependent exoDNAse (exonuclease V) beta subunit